MENTENKDLKTILKENGFIVEEHIMQTVEQKKAHNERIRKILDELVKED